MRIGLSSCGVLGVGLALVAGMSLVAGCDSCPDLWYQAFEFDLSGADPTHVRMTVTDPATGEVPCSDISLAENCKAGEGVYDLSFVVSGTAIGELTGVCTLGDQTDCAAEDAEARGPSPLIRIWRDASTWNLSLERQGPCPP